MHGVHSEQSPNELSGLIGWEPPILLEDDLSVSLSDHGHGQSSAVRVRILPKTNEAQRHPIGLTLGRS